MKGAKYGLVSMVHWGQGPIPVLKTRQKKGKIIKKKKPTYCMKRKRNPTTAFSEQRTTSSEDHSLARKKSPIKNGEGFNLKALTRTGKKKH